MSSAQETTRVCLACGLETQDEISTCPNDGSLMTAGADPLVGTTFLEKYHITSVLGRGGMSAVYKAKHLMMDRFVAIKYLRQELVHDNVMLQRFQLESKAVSMLKHPNIIGVHDFGLSPQGVPYLIMDFLEGQTVADLVAEKEFLEPGRTVGLFTQVCSALAHTHNKGVIHRDIKPSNLMVSVIDGEEFAQVVDFGIAKLLEREATGQSKLTASGEVFGSPAYMSPEQCNGSTIDARTDIYALACVIYNCLTGRPPLLGRNAMETVLMHIRDTPKPFAEIRPDLSISPVLEKVVFKSLSKDPDDRHQTMTEFGAELAQSLLETNNNTTWIIPAQKAVQDSVANNFEHTMPVGQAPQTVPTTEANNPHQTQNIRPDAVAPSTDLGHADPVVSLNENAGQDSRGDGARGRMNPNSMIMPGSDLFGYDALLPAASDDHVTSSSGVQANTNQPPNAAFLSQPAKAEFVEEVPLAAPVRHAPVVHPSSSIALPVNQSNNNQHGANSATPRPIQPTSNAVSSNPSTNNGLQHKPDDNSKNNRTLLIVGAVSVLVVIVLILITWKMQSS